MLNAPMCFHAHAAREAILFCGLVTGGSSGKAILKSRINLMVTENLGEDDVQAALWERVRRIMFTDTDSGSGGASASAA